MRLPLLQLHCVPTSTIMRSLKRSVDACSSNGNKVLQLLLILDGAVNCVSGMRPPQPDELPFGAIETIVKGSEHTPLRLTCYAKSVIIYALCVGRQSLTLSSQKSEGRFLRQRLRGQKKAGISLSYRRFSIPGHLVSNAKWMH